IQYPFYKVPSKTEHSISNSKKTIDEIFNSLKVVETLNSLNLRSDEGKHLPKEQRQLLNRLLQEFKKGLMQEESQHHLVNTALILETVHQLQSSLRV
ncbi:hypothetical protein NPIL_232961, partial [Nephila pilipes]